MPAVLRFPAQLCSPTRFPAQLCSPSKRPFHGPPAWPPPSSQTRGAAGLSGRAVCRGSCAKGWVVRTGAAAHRTEPGHRALHQGNKGNRAEHELPPPVSRRWPGRKGVNAAEQERAAHWGGQGRLARGRSAPAQRQHTAHLHSTQLATERANCNVGPSPDPPVSQAVEGGVCHPVLAGAAVRAAAAPALLLALANVAICARARGRAAAA